MSEDNILTPHGWIRGRLVHEHGKVIAIEGTPCDPADNDLPYLLPGFIDLHVHGGGGKDIMEGSARLRDHHPHPRALWHHLAAGHHHDRAGGGNLPRARRNSATFCEQRPARQRPGARRAPGRPLHQPGKTRRPAQLRPHRADGRSRSLPAPGADPGDHHRAGNRRP